MYFDQLILCYYTKRFFIYFAVKKRVHDHCSLDETFFTEKINDIRDESNGK
jgi:hypothetical protein